MSEKGIPTFEYSSLSPVFSTEYSVFKVVYTYKSSLYENQIVPPGTIHP